MSESAAAAASPAPAPPLDFSAVTDADLFEGMALAGTCVARAHCAFAEFHRRHARYLFAVCASRYRDAAEEIVAEVLRRVYVCAARFDRSTLGTEPNADRRLVRAWVGQLVRWVAADHFGARERRLPTVELADANWLADSRTETDSPTPGAELVGHVRAVIEELPLREQEIAWTVAHGWSPEHGRLRWSQADLDAIAQRFGLTRDNLRQVRARLIKKLRARLAPFLSGPRSADR
jgi:DNA-directed RNA polymerase specialized sigma24 family protein